MSEGLFNEAKGALQRLEQDLAFRLRLFENETGVKMSLDVSDYAWVDEEERRHWDVSVSATGEVVG